MRVISGKYKGRRLKGPEGAELRPTGDRLKGSLFNILAPCIADAVVLDAFGGSGAIGIEALSRGAREIVFIENSVAGCRLIRKNLDLCGIAKGYAIMQQDIFKAMRFLAREGAAFDILFFDPPYDWNPYADLLDIVFRKGLMSGASQTIIEHRRGALLPETGETYRRVRLLRQGDHCLSFYRPSDNPDRGPE
ncbi:MAG TPA: 16S rRNA (guanine(966)-N(2))-methyltransferase RsmD [Acidobacteriota bacterium]|nr:16S rRNA (guanine(966)-N(2))-methyltransferase RsmD [Acidobacteriota bacterium]